MTEQIEGDPYDKAKFESRSLFAEGGKRSATSGWMCRLMLIVITVLAIFSLGVWSMMGLDQSRDKTIELNNERLMAIVLEMGDTDRLSDLLAYSPLGDSASGWMLYESMLTEPSRQSQVFIQASSRLQGQELFKYLESAVVNTGPGVYSMKPALADRLEAPTADLTMSCFRALGNYYQPERYNPDLASRSDIEKKLRATIADIQIALPTSTPPCRLNPIATMDPIYD